jgi:peptidoglycan/xylan/chitin deacetylase (PgdA/CDA1 family)
MYLHKTPIWLGSLFPNILWSINTEAKEIYLTFDDGPVPDATPWVLEQLNQYNAKATFFMVGDNIHKHYELFTEVVNHQHTVGNHTFNHLNGWITNNQTYFENVSKAEKIIGTNTSQLFRPPHGRLKWSQYRRLKKNYNIVMWDVLSGDFNSSLSQEDCLGKSIKATVPGSVIVFHDSAKTIDKLKYVLPRYLEYFAALNFTFKAL